MGCTCSKASQPLPTLLQRRSSPTRTPSRVKSTDTQCQATEGEEEADLNLPSLDAELNLTPDVAPILEGEDDPSRDCSWFCCTSKAKRSLESWELHLLRVSLELKMKLKDPHFVAKRCDLDSSGDLDMHELKQATRAFGLKFSPEKLEKLMAGETRIDQERFAQIVADSPMTSERPTIPHSLRGMALGQLQQLVLIFINSGWLSTKCNAFNMDNADDIRERKKFPQAPNLYAMDTFVVTPMSQPGRCAARDQDSGNVVPQTYEKMSFSEVVNPHGLIVHCFVSHFWGHLFSQTVTALRRWAEMNSQRMGVENPKSMVYWICPFALNQHAVADEVGENPMQGPFNAALAQAEGGAVMVLDEEINPFKRIWCLFEISRLKELNQPFELICEMGSLSKPENLGQTDAMEGLLQATCEALWTVSAFNAKASVEEDRIRIWAEIANQGSRKLLKGLVDAFHHDITSFSPDETQFSEFDQFSQALLSSSLLQFFLLHKRHGAAAKCCEKGAYFTKEQFADIYVHGVAEEDRSIWLANLLEINARDDRLDIVRLLLQSGVCMEAVHRALLNAVRHGHEAATKLLFDHGEGMRMPSLIKSAAFGGNEAVTRLLLDLGANVAAADEDGMTALMASAANGHEAVTKLLLDHGADLAAAMDNGRTALLLAALGGHEGVAKLLLDHRADVASTDNDGITALILAAACGHEGVARALLLHGANVAAATTTGKTALIQAAMRGHEAVSKLLLDHGATVTAADKNGVTALICAAFHGHEAVTKLLLDHGADVAAAADNGITALIAASQGGYEGVARLLLDHRADVASTDNDGATALIYAAVGGHEAVSKLLLDHGASVVVPADNGQTALVVASQGGYEAVAKLLLNHGADMASTDNDGATALIYAADGGHEAVARALLLHGANVTAADDDGVTALMQAALKGHEAVTKLLLDHGANVAATASTGQTALIYAAYAGHEAVSKLMLDHRANVTAADNKGQTALITSAANGHEAVTKLLLNQRANVTAADNDGVTALMQAALKGHEAVTKLLLDRGANVAATASTGQTALMVAAFGGHEGVAKLLLDHGADVASTDNDGWTALMLAALKGHEAVTKLLLDRGANVVAAAKTGQTALIYAASNGHEAVTKLLLDHGADLAPQ